MLTPDRLSKILADLERWEGSTSWMYLDSATPPNVTIGLGCLVSSVDAACALPFCRGVNTGQAIVTYAATREQIAADFLRVSAMPAGFQAIRYHSGSVIYLRPDAIAALASTRLTETFLPGLTALCPDFEAFPESAQSALIDMAWNLGIAGLAKFHLLMAACNSGDWSAAAQQCHVSTSRPERNAWRAAQFAAAGGDA